MKLDINYFKVIAKPSKKPTKKERARKMAEKLLAEEADASAEEANGDVEDQSDSDEPKKEIS